jgi:LPXTG-site transpeptidase (sortase) family protein
VSAPTAPGTVDQPSPELIDPFDPVGPSGDAAPDLAVPGEEPTGSDHRGRRIVIGGFIVLVVLAALVMFLLPLAAEQRQQQRADAYTEPSPRYRLGEPAFVLQIPAIGVNQVVVWGANPTELRGGPGWRRGTAGPGQGNTVVQGHSTLWDATFASLSDLPASSIISVRTIDARVYRYRVTKVRTVPDDRTAPMRQAGPRRLTIVTSAGGPFNTHRVVATAESIGASPEVPRQYRVRVQRGDPGPYDDRPPGDLFLLVGGLVVCGLGVWGAWSFRNRRSALAIAMVAGPSIALGLVLVLFNLDAFLPTTF